MLSIYGITSFADNTVPLFLWVQNRMRQACSLISANVFESLPLIMGKTLHTPQIILFIKPKYFQNFNNDLADKQCYFDCV